MDLKSFSLYKLKFFKKFVEGKNKLQRDISGKGDKWTDRQIFLVIL